MKSVNYTENQLLLEEKRKVTKYTTDSSFEIETKNNCNCIAYLFESDIKGVKDFRVVIFEGRKMKASFYYRFSTIEKRNDYLNKYFENKEKQHQYLIEKKNVKKNRKIQLSEKIKVGSILHGSWGYEQTNCELYQVIEKISDFKVVIREVKQETIEGTADHSSCSVKPILNDFIGEPITKLISEYGVKVHRSCTLKPANEKTSFYKSWGY